MIKYKIDDDTVNDKKKNIFFNNFLLYPTFHLPHHDDLDDRSYVQREDMAQYYEFLVFRRII